MPSKTVKASTPSWKDRSISHKELSEHSYPGDVWIGVFGKVYDVTKFWKTHPGGSVLLSCAGKDATDSFQAFHTGPEAYLLLKNPLGVLEKSDEDDSALLSEFRALRKDLIQEKLFESNKLYFTLVCSIIIFLHIIGVSLLHYSLCTTTFIISTFLVGVAWGQAGFLMHDFGHKSVFQSNRLNNLGHILSYGYLLGGCPKWWNGRHNRHHAAPNHRKWDLDIRTLPLFAWDKKMAKKASLGWLIKYQSLYWPILGPPLIFLFYKLWNAYFMLQQDQWMLGVLVLHHATWFAILPSFSLGLHVLYLSLVLVWMGTYLGWVFSLNHYMHPLHEESKDWVSSTAVTTQNIKPSLFVEWLTGGLSYQIEHHLFPTLPRSSYRLISQRVRTLLQKHQLPYVEVGLGTAILDVFRTLHQATS